MVGQTFVIFFLSWPFSFFFSTFLFSFPLSVSPTSVGDLGSHFCHFAVLYFTHIVAIPPCGFGAAVE